jgi:hypothetical protein
MKTLYYIKLKDMINITKISFNHDVKYVPRYVVVKKRIIISKMKEVFNHLTELNKGNC